MIWCKCKKYRRILKSYYTLLAGKKKRQMEKRIITCLYCDKHKWVLGLLFCGDCWCYIPAKTQDGDCPLDRW